MKIILAVTAVSLVIMTIACKTSDENITPTTNATNNSTNTTIHVNLRSQGNMIRLYG